MKRVAVIGAGVMGSGIAAQVANAGVDVLLLDRGDIAARALLAMQKTSPAPFMDKAAVSRVAAADSDTELEKIADCDWIIEVIVERLDIKQALYRRIDAVCRADAVVSSNTSTIPLAQLIEGLPDRFAGRFMITHFFNPPRYMRLLELVSGTRTDPAALDRVTAFCDVAMGKTTVTCHDTPGFIANRIGTYWMQEGLNAALDLGLTVEQADAAMGQPAGIPRTGVFGLLDLIGLDLMPHVVDSLHRTLPAADPFQACVREWPLVHKLVAAGSTGRKGGGGFYRLDRTGGAKRMQAVDLQTGAYRDQQAAKISARDLPSLLSMTGPIGDYARRVLGGTMAYAALLVGEIADDIVAIDAAMRLGYNWRLGPFEMIDAVGVNDFVGQLRAAGAPVPRLLELGRSLYRLHQGRRQFLGLDGDYHDIVRPPGVLLLDDVKRAAAPLLQNASAALWDIGEGVACFEVTAKSGSLDPAAIELLAATIELVGRQFKALVIGHDGEAFSAGANLALVASAARRGAWDEIEKLLTNGQDVFRALKYAPFPVVAAPAGLALDGGCELCLHADAVQAHAELSIGLAAGNVGLIPGWGGCAAVLDRWQSHGGQAAAATRAYDQIGMAAVSSSAAGARALLYLRPADGVSMNRDRVLADAKARALAMAPSYRPPQPPSFTLAGRAGFAAMKAGAESLRQRGVASDYDVMVFEALADVLSGGRAAPQAIVSEAELLRLERAGFKFLVRNQATIERIEHMLATGRPLSN